MVGKAIDENIQQSNEGGLAKQSPNFEEYKQLFHKSFIQCNEELDFTNFDVNLR